MALPEERKFVTFRRGKVRDDIILARFRNTLRGKLNPDTGNPFTEDEIAIITQVDSRFFIEADAIDLYGQAVQQRAVWFADQVRPERAASEWLRNVHGKMWLPEGLLPASGGSGPVLATASPGTVYPGSTTLGDPLATFARAPSGKRYQVLVTTAADAQGEARLVMQAIDPGDDSDLLAGTVLTWINPPINSDPQASVEENFTGGFDQETEAEFAQRILRRMRAKPGAGNGPQFRLWAQQVSNAVQDAFVYMGALHAGSVIVCVLQKRGSTQGPLARVASVGTLANVTSFLVPPTSPVVPHGAHVLVVPVNPQPTDMIMTLSMQRGTSGGWTDIDPWPRFTAAFEEGVKILSVVTQSSFVIQTDSPPRPGMSPGSVLSGVNAPSLMVWDPDISRFETLNVDSVTYDGGNDYSVVLNTEPTKTLVAGDVISPNNERSQVLAETFEGYFDELGPSELVETTDTRFVRAARYPRPDQEYPLRAGQSVIARLDDQLGGALADAELKFITQNTPDIPPETIIVNGPNILTLGNVGIYAFES